jgi:hypothetical protein
MSRVAPDAGVLVDDATAALLGGDLCVRAGKLGLYLRVTRF